MKGTPEDKQKGTFEYSETEYIHSCCRFSRQFWEVDVFVWQNKELPAFCFHSLLFPILWKTDKQQRMQIFFPFLSTECFFNFLLITVCMCFCTSVSVQVCASGQHSSLSSQSDLYHPRLSGWGYLARGPPLLKGRSGTQIVTLSLRVFFFIFTSSFTLPTSVLSLIIH